MDVVVAVAGGVVVVAVAGVAAAAGVVAVAGVVVVVAAAHWFCEHGPCKTNVGTLNCLCSHYCTTVHVTGML